jgi:hypothetical protein
MRRTTIALPDDLADLVEREARRRHTSVSEIVRTAISAHFKLDQPRELPFANLGRSGLPGVADRLEEVMAEEWLKDIEDDAFGGGR